VNALPPSSAIATLLGTPVVAHGRLPQDVGEWAFFALVALVGAWVLWKAVEHSVHPGEEAPDHVKRSILADEDAAHPALDPAVRAGMPPQAPSVRPPHPT
jgi:hypothetical protein